MKYLLLSLCLLIFGNIFSQKIYYKREIRKHQAMVRKSKIKRTVILSLDTIFDKGIPYALLKKRKQLPFVDYSLYSLNNENLAFIQSRRTSGDYPYYSFKFSESGNVAEIDRYEKSSLENLIVQNKLINDNKIDPFNETNFLLKFPQKFSNPGLKTFVTDNPEKDVLNSSNVYATVIRNREAKFYFKDGKIIQDHKFIARYKIIDSLVRFYLPSGLQAAAAEEKVNELGVWNVTSLKDNKKTVVKSLTKESLEEIIQFLIEKFYL